MEANEPFCHGCGLIHFSYIDPHYIANNPGTAYCVCIISDGLPSVAPGAPWEWWPAASQSTAEDAHAADSLVSGTQPYNYDGNADFNWDTDIIPTNGGEHSNFDGERWPAGAHAITAAGAADGQSSSSAGTDPAGPTSCGKCKARPCKEGRRTCEECTQKKRASDRRRHEERKLAGICIKCGLDTPKTPAHLHCRWCLEKSSAKGRAARKEPVVYLGLRY